MTPRALVFEDQYEAAVSEAAAARSALGKALTRYVVAHSVLAALTGDVHPPEWR